MYVMFILRIAKVAFLSALCFRRHVKPLVPAAVTVVSTHFIPRNIKVKQATGGK
jgi:hypothetical protein